jgi:ABC-type antimicrobial peptide transport system permease subunit
VSRRGSAGYWVNSVLGTSIFSGLPVTTLIRQRLWPTVALTILAMLLAVGAALPLGVLAAWKQGSWVARVSAVAANLWSTRDPQSMRPVVRLRTPSAELFLALTVLAINMIGDGLRDLLKVR